MKVQNHKSKIALKLFLILIVSQLFTTFAYGSTLKEIVISDVLNTDKSVTETISISIIDNTDTKFSTTLSNDAYNIYVNDERLDSSNISYPLNCTSCNIKIRYSIPKLVKQESIGAYSFYRTLSTPQTPENFKYVVYLPKGYLIEGLSDPNSGNIVPLPKEVLSDGESVILIWSETNPQFPKQYLIKYSGHETKETFTQSIADLKHLSVIIVIILFLIIGLIAGYYYNHHKNKNKKNMAKTSSVIPSSLLSPDEKAVVEFLKKSNAHKTAVNQKIIGKELNWSKSKVSSVLSNLSYKKIIEKEKIGRNYSVKLLREVN